jgi:hypothetical protein
LRAVWQLADVVSYRSKGAYKFQGIRSFIRYDFELMVRGFGEGGALSPSCSDKIGVLVQLACKNGVVGLDSSQSCGVRIRMAPIGGSCITGTVREMDLDAEALRFYQRGRDVHGNGVGVGRADGLHINGLAVEFEVANDFAVPEVEGLGDVGQIVRLGEGAVRFFQDETDLAEVQAMRVGAEPFDFGRLLVVRDVGVGDGAAIEIGVELELKGVDAPVVRVGCGVPTPIGKCAERDGVLEGVAESLQASGVYGEGEFAVADGEGVVNVELVEDDVVAGDEGVAVDGGAQGREGRKR